MSGSGASNDDERVEQGGWRSGSSYGAGVLSSLGFEPPVLRSGLLFRPQLVHALLGRWQSRVTVVAGGAGLGKTTLLAQALAENRLAPRGEDVWVDLDGHAAHGIELAQLVAAAVSSRDAVGEALDAAARLDADVVAAALWRRAPTEMCLVFDDVHAVAAGSPDARWLGALIDALPSNAHVVLATRQASLPVPLARLDAQGEVLRLGEGDLRFNEDELARYAAARGVEPEVLASTGGWPALAELAATVGGDVPGAFLWEEVLRPLGAERRRVLAVLCDLGGGDDDLVSAALGGHVDLDRVLDAVPLIGRHVDGWHVPHSLWSDAAGVAVEEAERREIRARAVAHLVERERFDEAFRLASQADLWDLAPGVLRSACLSSESHRSRRLGRWLMVCPEAVQESLAGRLAAALHTAFTAPSRAGEPLRATATLARTSGDVDAELCAIAQLGRLGWFSQDPSVLGPGLALRVVELAEAGHPRARALVAFGRATMADLAGDDAKVLSELSGIESGALDPGWEIMACWLYGMVRLGLGDADGVCELVERFAATDDPALRMVLDGLRLRSWWALGQVDEVVREAPAALDTVRASGVASNRHLVSTNTSILFSHIGEVTKARGCLEEGKAVAPSPPGRGQPVRLALATASLQLAEGDEHEAASTLRAAIESHGLDRGIDRRGWRQLLALTYVLVPETRDHWDGQDLRGYLRTTRQLARAVVAGRSGHGARHLCDLEMPDAGVVRSALPVRFAAELAVGLATCGREEGAVLLDSLGAPGREVVRSFTAGPAPLAKYARTMLASLPGAPPHTTYVGALGAFVLRHDDGLRADGAHPGLRRRRVQELLAFLISHRHTTRPAIAAALWPGLDEDLAANNLSVTLSHLLHTLEPWRRPGEAAYLIRVSGPNVRLVVGEQLRIDLDDFDRHLDAAARAEADGIPSTALEHQLAAIAFYRGDLYSDLPDADWITLDREHYRTRFVTAAIRAAQLSLGLGNIDQAEHVAGRTLDVDPWAEGAHGILVAAALVRGHRSTARRRLGLCLQALEQLGVRPSHATQQLQRRIQTDHPAPPPGNPTPSTATRTGSPPP